MCEEIEGSGVHVPAPPRCNTAAHFERVFDFASANYCREDRRSTPPALRIASGQSQTDYFSARKARSSCLRLSTPDTLADLERLSRVDHRLSVPSRARHTPFFFFFGRIPQIEGSGRYRPLECNQCPPTRCRRSLQPNQDVVHPNHKNKRAGPNTISICRPTIGHSRRKEYRLQSMPANIRPA